MNDFPLDTDESTIDLPVDESTEPTAEELRGKLLELSCTHVLGLFAGGGYK